MSRAARLLGLPVLAAVAAAIAIYRPPEPEKAPSPPEKASVTARGYEIVREYPHDTDAFTQGLVYRDGFLYESTGLKGRSSLRKVELETGRVIQRRPVDDRYFGEGLTDWHGKLVQLTPMRTIPTVHSTLAQIEDFAFVQAAVERRRGFNTGVNHDIASFKPQSTFMYLRKSSQKN